VTAASIVITNHDHGRFVAQAIDSALAQTHAAVEVVVVDDGSTDDSRRIIEGYHDAVRVLFREHGGQACAMLDGFRRSLRGGRPVPR
jgi:glycosyltransferase involved in cell wall biosynthesis